MTTLLIICAWAASCLLALRVGYYAGMRVPYGRSLRREAMRRLRVMSVYLRATLAVLSPTYKRRWDRQREATRQAFLDSLIPIERAPWATEQQEFR